MLCAAAKQISRLHSAYVNDQTDPRRRGAESCRCIQHKVKGAQRRPQVANNALDQNSLLGSSSKVSPYRFDCINQFGLTHHSSELAHKILSYFSNYVILVDATFGKLVLHLVYKVKS